MTKPIPEGYHTISPAMFFKDTRKAIEFYKKAFGAKERHVMPGPDGKGVMHAEIKIGDSIMMMADENSMVKSAESLGSTPVKFYVYVEDVDSSFKKAVEAGSKVEMPVQDMFWGDRMGSLKDPFGYCWSLATHKKDPTPAEMKKGAEHACAEMAAKKR